MVLCTVLNSGARVILTTQIICSSAQNNPVAFCLPIKSQSCYTDICGRSHFVSLVRLELLSPESSSLNGSEPERPKRNLFEIWKAGVQEWSLLLEGLYSQIR